MVMLAQDKAGLASELGGESDCLAGSIGDAAPRLTSQ